MSTLLAADVLTALTGFGSILVKHSSGTTRGVLDDDESVEDLGGGALATIRKRRLLVAVAALPTLAAEDTLTLGALGDDATRTDHRVIDAYRMADGLTWEIYLDA